MREGPFLCGDERLRERASDRLVSIPPENRSRNGVPAATYVFSPSRADRASVGSARTHARRAPHEERPRTQAALRARSERGVETSHTPKSSHVLFGQLARYHIKNTKRRAAHTTNNLVAVTKTEREETEEEKENEQGGRSEATRLVF